MSGSLTAGSFCSGFLGIERGLSQVLDCELAWVSDNEPGPSALLAYHHPAVPNLGDLTALDWTQAAPVDLMCGGYPCTPFSQAGRRKGTADPRHIWPHIAAGLGVLAPRMVFLENVRGHLTLGFDVVLADLANLGYDVAWTVAAASDSGAPHARKRLFILAVRRLSQRLAEPDSFPVAVLDGGRWVTPGDGLFGPVPFAGRIPEDGVMCGGKMLARGSAATRGLLPTPDATHGRKTTRTGPLLPGVAESLLPTPAAGGFNDGESLESWTARNARLRESWSSEKHPHGNGNGMGTPLAIAVQMLRTPTAQIADNGGSQHPDKRKAGGHGPTLADEVEHLLPTPGATDSHGHYNRSGDRAGELLLPGVAESLLPTSNATDGNGGPRAVPESRTHRGQDHGPRLRDVAPDLLPTPMAADGGLNRGSSSGYGLRNTSREIAALLPTPGASDWKGSGQTQGRDRDGRPRPAGDADLPEAVELLPTPKPPPRNTGEAASVKLAGDYDGDLEAVITDLTSRKRRKDRATHGQLIIPGTTITPPPPVWDLSDTAEAWGKYAPAIARWETMLGRPAPPPTAPGRDGKPRLSPLAVEWMMAAPPGWVTGVPGLSRQQMLRLLGNGCVAPQAAMAAARLLAAVAALSDAVPALAERTA